MGGNVKVIDKNGVEVLAQKIDLKEIGRSNFINASKGLFKSINFLYKLKFKEPLWADLEQIDNSMVFNGSTSFIFSDEFTDDEIIAVKPKVGDIDIAFPEEKMSNLDSLLNSLRDVEVVKDITFIGFNPSRLGDQINGIFKYFTQGKEFFVQVDFEALPFEENGKPTEWARFSHSSSFKDAKNGVKAVHHKYIIRALVGAVSLRDDILIATPKSTAEKVKLSSKDEVVRMLKFSVQKGLRVAYEPLIDSNGDTVEINGKPVYKEIPTSQSDYKKTLEEIYKLLFNDYDKNEVKLLWDFEGCLDLCKKYLDSKQLEHLAARYFQLLWGLGSGNRGQELERDDPGLDAEVKFAGWEFFRKKMGIPEYPNLEKHLETYYADYKK